MERNLHRLACLVAASTLLTLSTAAARVATAQSVSGQAYGAYVQTPTASQARSPLAVLPSVSSGDGEMAEASGQALSVPGAFSSEMLTSVTSGAVGASTASAQSIATVSDVSVLNGLITAARVIGVASSTRNGFETVSNTLGSGFENLQVNGVTIVGDGAVEPNTRIQIPGVGYVVLNEVVETASGVTVNMIHVVLESTVGGLLGGVTTLKTGEIIVGSASSRVRS